MNETVQSLLDSWEDILLEIDLKLSPYFDTSPSDGSPDKSTDSQLNNSSLHDQSTTLNQSTLSTETAIKMEVKEEAPKKPCLSSDEFMELLVFGSASELLEKFLTDLGEKGLKKLGQSIELTYSNVQKLIVNHLERVCYHLLALFGSLNGMASWKEEFSVLNLSGEKIGAVLESVASLLVKSVELQQVIDTSVKNVKSFFRWLYTIMVRLWNAHADANASLLSNSDLTKISQQDLQFVASFIEENFDASDANLRDANLRDANLRDANLGDANIRETRPSMRRSSMFTLEPVGQYFRQGPLKYTNCSMNKLSINPWIKFLDSNPGFPLFPNARCHHRSGTNGGSCINCNPLLKHNRNHSLIQEYNAVTDAVKMALDTISVSLPALCQGMIVHDSEHTLTVKSEPSPSEPLSQAPVEPSKETEHAQFHSSSITSFPSNCTYTLSSVSNKTVSIMSCHLEESCSNYRVEISSIQFFTDDETLQIASFSCYDSESAFFLLRGSCESHLCRVPFADLLVNSCVVDVGVHAKGSDPKHDSEMSHDSEVSHESDSRKATNIQSLLNSRIPTRIEVGPHRGVSTKLPGITWTSVAVSAARKVASVTSGRRVRIFDLDDTGYLEDEDGEEGEGEEDHDDEPM